MPVPSSYVTMVGISPRLGIPLHSGKRPSSRHVGWRSRRNLCHRSSSHLPPPCALILTRMNFSTYKTTSGVFLPVRGRMYPRD